jgi:predicted HTH transcriptional regulator
VPLRTPKLEALGVLTRYQGKVVATNAGVILFGHDVTRRRYFGDARVEGARFAGATRAADIEDVLDPDEELTVLEAIDAADRFIRRNTRQAEPIPRERLAEFSPVMVRELLVNAGRARRLLKSWRDDQGVRVRRPRRDPQSWADAARSDD